VRGLPAGTRLPQDVVDLYAWLNKAKPCDERSRTILPGQDWELEIRKVILKSDVVIACLSRGFNKQKGFRHEELKIAFQRVDLIPGDEIFIIPLRLEECDMPESLRHLHCVDLFETDGYKKLVRALRKYVD
jgi:hypothetical protein